VVELKGFWSYVHADDDADGGRVSRLAHDVAAQFEMLTGENIDLLLGFLWCRSVEQDCKQSCHDEEHPHVADYTYVS
jgi:hypothetical protein